MKIKRKVLVRSIPFDYVGSGINTTYKIHNTSELTQVFENVKRDLVEKNIYFDYEIKEVLYNGEKMKLILKCQSKELLKNICNKMTEHYGSMYTFNWNCNWGEWI